MVALTGIEPDHRQFSTVQLDLSSCVFSPVGTRLGHPTLRWRADAASTQADRPVSCANSFWFWRAAQLAFKLCDLNAGAADLLTKVLAQ
jgi:hypothetical protein